MFDPMVFFQVFVFNFCWGSPDGSDSKESAYNSADSGSVPGWGRSPEEENGYPHFSILAWRIFIWPIFLFGLIFIGL